MRQYAFRDLLRSAGPSLFFGVRLWASSCLALYIAFRLELDSPYWAATSAAIVCQPQLGASLRKGWFRMIGTIAGAVAVVLMAACFPQDPLAFLVALSLWGGLCALSATLLRNFAAYAAALAGYTAAIIAGDQLGSVGSLSQHIFMTALTRVTEICIGIFCAGLVLSGTDLGRARRQLISLLADLTTGISAGFATTLKSAEGALRCMQPMRRDLIRRAIALDSAIDLTIGESAQIRHHSLTLQRALDGLFTALSGWNALENHLARRSYDRGGEESAIILKCLPPEFSQPERAEPARWVSDPARFHRSCEVAINCLTALAADTPSLRLLADETARALVGIGHAVNGLALLVAAPVKPIPRDHGIARPRVPDWMPALVNAARAFVAIGTAALFWIVTAWPSGATAITWATITVTLMAAQGDKASSNAIRLVCGNVLAVAFAAILLFAVLPRVETFAGLSVAVGVYMVTFGALMTQPWETALTVPMVGHFFAFLQPTNQMSYDSGSFYNSAIAIIGGCALSAAAFRILPFPSPTFRTRRLLRLTLRDLRRLAVEHTFNDWEGRIRGRLLVMPAEATPLQRAQLLAALSVGSEITQLRDIIAWLGLDAALDPALGAISKGASAAAAAHLARLEAVISAASGAAGASQTVLRARGSILVITEGLTQHAPYFDREAIA
jgi:uncharacterized membrane protein YccC